MWSGSLSECPSCDPPEGRILHTSAYARALRDAYPVAEGHTLVVPIRHVTSLFELDSGEQLDAWIVSGGCGRSLWFRMRRMVSRSASNDGTAAGQTIDHAHVHVIPRYAGDVPDPRGGIRWVIPEQAPYWDDEAP